MFTDTNYLQPQPIGMLADLTATCHKGWSFSQDPRMSQFSDHTGTPGTRASQNSTALRDSPAFQGQWQVSPSSGIHHG